jgi:hypothetical protein
MVTSLMEKCPTLLEPPYRSTSLIWKHAPSRTSVHVHLVHVKTPLPTRRTTDNPFPGPGYMSTSLTTQRPTSPKTTKKSASLIRNDPPP